ALVELAFAKLDAKLFARAQVLFALCGDLAFGRAWSGRRQRRLQNIENALFRCLFGAVGDFIELFLADHVDGSLDEVAHHGLDVAADVAQDRKSTRLNPRHVAISYAVVWSKKKKANNGQGNPNEADKADHAEND